MRTKGLPQAKKTPIWIHLTAVGVVLFIGIVGTLEYRDFLRTPADDAPRVSFTVDGLDCPVWCSVRLTESIDGLDGARVESFDQKTGNVIVRYDPSRQDVAALCELFGARGFVVQSAVPAGAR